MTPDEELILRQSAAMSDGLKFEADVKQHEIAKLLTRLSEADKKETKNHVENLKLAKQALRHCSTTASFGEALGLMAIAETIQKQIDKYKENT